MYHPVIWVLGVHISTPEDQTTKKNSWHLSLWLFCSLIFYVLWFVAYHCKRLQKLRLAQQQDNDSNWRMCWKKWHLSPPFFYYLLLFTIQNSRGRGRKTGVMHMAVIIDQTHIHSRLHTYTGSPLDDGHTPQYMCNSRKSFRYSPARPSLTRHYLGESDLLCCCERRVPPFACFLRLRFGF